MVGAMPHAAISMVVFEHGFTIIDAFPGHIAGPVVRRAVQDAGVGQVIRIHIRDLRTWPPTCICCVISVFSLLSIAELNASSLRHISIFIQRTVLHTKPRRILRKPEFRTKVFAGPVPFISVVVHLLGAFIQSWANRYTCLSVVVRKIPSRAVSQAVSCRISRVIHERNVAYWLTHPCRVISIRPGASVIRAHCHTSDGTIISIVLWVGRTSLHAS